MQKAQRLPAKRQAATSVRAEGGKHPVYCGNKQIAQIDKPCEIYNDLHHYTIYAVDQDAAEISALFAAYMYINASFEPGQKVKQSYTKCTSITLNKTLKQKYNPDFKEENISN
mgnify:CR=1 FL=1